MEGPLDTNSDCPLVEHYRYPDKSTSLSEVPMRRRRNGAHGLAPRPRPGRSQHPRVNRQHSVPRRTRPTRPASLLWRAEVPPRNAPGNHDIWKEQGEGSEAWTTARASTNPHQGCPDLKQEHVGVTPEPMPYWAFTLLP